MSPGKYSSSPLKKAVFLAAVRLPDKYTPYAGKHTLMKIQIA
jgi:hypothetical protein